MNEKAWLWIVLWSASHVLAAEPQQSSVAVPSRRSAKDESVTPARHLADVFNAVASERQKLPPIEPQSTRISSHFTERNLAPWSIQTHQVVEHFLVRSLPLESLALEVAELYGGTKVEHARAEAFLNAAATRANDVNPQHRALSAEFLAMLPMATLESGLITSIAPLLGDETIAFPSISAFSGQAFGSGSIQTSEMSVEQVASAAIAALTPFRFGSSQTFNRWWETHHNVRKHPWYWAIRWQKIPAEQDLHSVASLGLDEGLRMLLLAGNQLAVNREAHRVGQDADSNFLQQVETVSRYPSTDKAASLFVYRHNLHHRLLEILAGQIPWAEAEGQPAKDLQHFAASIFGEVATANDLPLIEKLLDSPTGPLASNVDLHVKLTRLITNRLPEQSEEILLKQLKWHLDYHLLACDLLQQTGFVHWELIKKSYGTPMERSHHRSQIITAVAYTGDASAKEKLAELFSMDDLTVATDGTDGTGLLREVRFLGFVEAAQAIRGAPVVTNEEAQAARYQGGKGRRDPAINKLVPENRRKAIDKLRAFFGSVR